MDYTNGALDVPRGGILAAALHRLGNPREGNSTFILKNFWDLIGDRRYYVLTEEAARQFIDDVVSAEDWLEEVGDCDSKTTCAGADIIRAAKARGWKYGMAAFWISYTSKTMGLPHDPNNRMAGYHQALLIFVRRGDDILAFIVQPPHRYASGKTRAAVWALPADEVRFWVVAGGLT